MADEVQDPERALLAGGDPEAFGAFFDRHGRGMLALARTLVGSRGDAEDAVQQTFLNLFQARRAFARAQSPRAYAFAVLRNTSLRIRERRREDPLNDEVSGPSESIAGASAEHSAALERALAKLPTKQREVLALKFDGDLTFTEIGLALSISPNTAASRYRYALEHLSQSLGGRA